MQETIPLSCKLNYILVSWMWHHQCTAAHNSIWFHFSHLCVPLVKSRCIAKLFKHISSSNMSWTGASHSLTDSSGSCVGGFGVSLWSFMWLSCWWAVLSALPSWVSVPFDFEEFTHLYPSENTVLCKTLLNYAESTSLL